MFQNDTTTFLKGDNMSSKTIGERIAELRKKAGEKQEELAQILECNRGSLANYETGKRNTGCRRGELCALKWSDIDFDKYQISITKSLYQLTGQQAQVKPTKTNKERKVAIPPYCINLLQQLQVQQRDRRLKLGTAWKGMTDNWVFTKYDGSNMHITTPTQNFSDFLKRHNLPHIKFHALRHTSATLLLLNGTNIKNVAARLGHSQLQTGMYMLLRKLTEQRRTAWAIRLYLSDGKKHKIKVTVLSALIIRYVYKKWGTVNRNNLKLSPNSQNHKNKRLG